MDFDLSEEQVALQEVARDFLKERWPSDRTREVLEKPPGMVDEAVWREIVEMGWLGVAASEEAGGIGGDVLTAAVLAEETGRGLLPGPLLSDLAAAVALERCGDLRGAEALIGGEARAVIALDEPGGHWGIEDLATEAKSANGGWVLSGTKILVPDTEGADFLLVAARTPAGPRLVRVEAAAAGVAFEPMRRLDGQSIAEVTFSDVRVSEAAVLGDAAALEASLDVWTTLCAADLLGVAQAVLEQSTAYALEREQFGRPIGSFQAVSHRLADVCIEVEIGRSLLYGACLALDERREDAPAFVSAAKAWLSDAAVAAAEAALKVHAGVGFTWEYDIHLYLRRARSNAATLGDADWHRDRVAAHLAQQSEAVGSS